MSSRYTFTASHAPSAQRKSRVDGKLSFIPKPKLSRQGSYDRLSETGWRPGRPRSLEPPRGLDPPRAGVSTGRPSRDPGQPSASKMSQSQRSRSAQLMTPMNKQSYSRSTTTPNRTPSSDRSARSWQNSLERALGFVTAKDTRPISNMKWQKVTSMRVNDELERRSGGAGGAALVKPLTITRFVDITASLLSCLMDKVRLDSTNYVTKLPHITKRLLYPGVVSKSWLKTVNTLHTYPSALALIVYLLDLALRVETPADCEVIYAERDELSRLRREYLAECWRIWNDQCNDFTAVDEAHLPRVRQLLGDDDEKRARILQIIKDYRQQLDDPAELAARAEEQRRQEHLSQLVEALREIKSRRIQDNGRMDAACHQQTSLLEATHQLRAENERTQQDLEQLKREVSEQPLSTAERASLLDKVDYSNRVIDSKKELVEQVCKMLQKTESDLALSQKQCLSACVEYNQRIISLTSSHADCAGLAVEERDLMNTCTVEAVESSVEALRAKHTALAEANREAERARVATARRLSERSYQLDQTTARVEEALQQTEQLKVKLRTEREEAAAERERIAREVAELQERAEQHYKRTAELEIRVKEMEELEEEDRLWRQKLQELTQYVSEQRTSADTRLEQCKQKRADMLLANVQQWNQQLRKINARYQQK